jgi:hypothetical protein
MNFFPIIFAVLAILLSAGSGEKSRPIVLVHESMAYPQIGPDCSVSDSFLNPLHTPPASESFFECLDESALDEEDSSKVEDHGIATLTFLDFETPLANDVFSNFLPATSLSRIVLITPILRC